MLVFISTVCFFYYFIYHIIFSFSIFDPLKGSGDAWREDARLHRRFMDLEEENNEQLQGSAFNTALYNHCHCDTPSSMFYTAFLLAYHFCCYTFIIVIIITVLLLLLLLLLLGMQTRLKHSERECHNLQLLIKQLHNKVVGEV